MHAWGRRQGWLLGIVGVWGALLLRPALPGWSAAPQRPSLQGTWKLNPDLTARLSKDQEEGEERDGGGKGDSRRSGGQHAPGGSIQDDPAVGNWSPSRDRNEAKERRDLVASLDSLTIAQQGGQLTIVDQNGHSRALKTDGSKVRDTGGLAPAQLRASWDKDGSLVVEVRPDKGNRHTEAYIVSNDGKHLYLTVTISGQAGQLLRAYDPAPAAPEPKPTPAEAAPPPPRR